MGLGCFLADDHLLEADELEALALKASDNFSDQTALDAVRLDCYKSSFHCGHCAPYI